MRGNLVAIALLLVIFGVAIAANKTPESEPPKKLVECADEATANQARDIMLRGLDYALQVRAFNLFETWMEDSTGQPERASKGLHKGVDAYLHGRKGILAWTIPPCR